MRAKRLEILSAIWAGAACGNQSQRAVFCSESDFKGVTCWTVGRFMTHSVRVVTFSLLISACAVAQTKLSVCFDAPARLVMNNPFPREVIFEHLPLRQTKLSLISPYEIILTHFVPPTEFTVHHRRSTDPSASAYPSEGSLLLPLLGTSRLCQMADRGPNGS